MPDSQPDLVTALISTAGSAAQLADDAYEAGDCLFPFGGAVNRIGRQLSSFSQMLTNASRSMERRTSCPRGQMREASLSLLRDGRRLLAETRELVNEVTAFHADYAEERDLQERLDELIRRPEVMMLRMELNSIRSAFATLISTVDTAEADDRYAPKTIRSSLRTQLMNAIRVMEELVSDLLAHCDCEPDIVAASSSSALESFNPTLPHISSEMKALAEHQEWLKARSTGDSSTSSRDTEHPKQDCHPRLRNARLVLQGAKLLHLGNPLKTLDLSSQQKVYRLAQDVLSNHNETTSWTWNSSHNSTRSSRRKHRVPEKGIYIPKESLTDQFAARTSWPNEEGLDILHLEDKDTESLPAGASVGVAPPKYLFENEIAAGESLDNENDPGSNDAVHGSDTEKDKSEPSSDSDESMKELEDWEVDLYFDTLNQPSSGKNHQSQPNLDQQQSDTVKYPPKTQCLNFEDAVGRKFMFPWSMVNTWKGMEKLIKQAFLHVDVIGPHVYEGHYDLVSQDGHIILPQIWSSTVQPTWQIKMMMWPFPEPEQHTQPIPFPPLPPASPLTSVVMPMVPPPAPAAPTSAANSMYMLPGVGVLSGGFGGGKGGRKTKLRQR